MMKNEVIREKLAEAGRSMLAEKVTDKKTLQSEVDLIKEKFGWSEHEILSLPVTRRKSYVLLLTGNTSEGR